MIGNNKMMMILRRIRRHYYYYYYYCHCDDKDDDNKNIYDIDDDIRGHDDNYDNKFMMINCSSSRNRRRERQRQRQRRFGLLFSFITMIRYIIYICIILLFICYIIHRIISYYVNYGTIWMAPPLMNIYRPCPAVEYITMEQIRYSMIQTNPILYPNYQSTYNTYKKPNICITSLSDNNNNNKDYIQYLLRFRYFNNIMNMTSSNKIQYCIKHQNCIYYDESNI